jgi:hypothetical protein
MGTTGISFVSYFKKTTCDVLWQSLPVVLIKIGNDISTTSFIFRVDRQSYSRHSLYWPFCRSFVRTYRAPDAYTAKVLEVVILP